MGWIHALDAVAEGIEVEVTRYAHILHAADSCLPVGSKPDTSPRIVTLDGTEAVHSAHIVDAIHHLPPGGLRIPVYRSRDGVMDLRRQAGWQVDPPYESASPEPALSLRRAMAASPSAIRFLSAAASSGVQE